MRSEGDHVADSGRSPDGVGKQAGAESRTCAMNFIGMGRNNVRKPVSAPTPRPLRAHPVHKTHGSPGSNKRRLSRYRFFSAKAVNRQAVLLRTF
jgi:hypothetical protein